MRIHVCNMLINFIENCKKGDFIDKKLWELERERALEMLQYEISISKVRNKIQSRKVYLNNKGDKKNE